MKKKGKKQPTTKKKEWRLVGNAGRTKFQLTTMVDKAVTDLMEYWAPFMLADGKIATTSSYEVSRYLIVNGTAALDKMYRERFGTKENAKPPAALDR